MTTCRVIWKFGLPMTDVVRLVDPKPLAVQYDANGVGAAWVEHTVDCDTGQPADGGGMNVHDHARRDGSTDDGDGRPYVHGSARQRPARVALLPRNRPGFCGGVDWVP
jgi:hypothetical protein